MYQAIYVHIPFCQSKCIYCDFTSYKSLYATQVDEYVDALCAEISSADIVQKTPITLYFGGGTPSLLDEGQLSRIFVALNKIGADFSEVSMECNPGTVSKEKLRAFKDIGVNRLSFGVQSFSDELLRMLGRIHTAKQALQAVEDARWAGFDSISMDLMYSLPKQNINDVICDLQTAVSMKIPHLSCYALKVEIDTPLHNLVHEGKLVLPDEDLEDEMYDFIPQYLKEHGYQRYEISNFALKGYACKHNKVYWQYRPYKAFGVSGCSFDGFSRYTNTTSLSDYIEAYKNQLPVPHSVEKLDKAIRQAEFIFMNMRTAEGVSAREFEDVFEVGFLDKYADFLSKNIARGVIICLPSKQYVLSERGFKYSNTVFEDLLVF